MEPMEWAAIAGAVLGLMKDQIGQKQATKEKSAQAEVARYSPWTKMEPKQIQSVNPLNGAMQGAFGGAMMGKQFGGSEAAAAAPAAGAGLTGQAAPYGQGMGVMPDNRTLEDQYPLLYQK